MRDYIADSWRRARKELAALPPGPRAAIKRYWQVFGFPGSPTIYDHKVRKVCFWSRLATLRRLALIRQGKLPFDILITR
jgi:hypothetical protein